MAFPEQNYWQKKAVSGKLDQYGNSHIGHITIGIII